MDDAEVDRVFAGKVWGAWYLSEAAADMQLDFFLSTSSIAAVWGSQRPDRLQRGQRLPRRVGLAAA